MSEIPGPPSFWETVGLLLDASSRRAAGRRRRQQELLSSRTRDANATDWSAVAAFFYFVWMISISVFAGLALNQAVKAGQRLDALHEGKVLVSISFLDEAMTREGCLQKVIPP